MSLVEPSVVSGVAESSRHQGLKPSTRGNILLFSYAFPPMQVQMTPAVFKPMAAMVALGYQVDVLCADSFCPELPLDDSLLPHCSRLFPNITRLNPPRGMAGWLQKRSRVFSRVPDLMTVLHRPAYEFLMDIDLSRYDAVMTWSPFHSINPVMVELKKARKNVRWIAQFSDPWAGNPLEISALTKWWNKHHQPQTLAVADHIVHSSSYSLEMMLSGASDAVRRKTSVLPHVFDTHLYPKRAKAQNDKLIMRYVGVLYGRRSPEALFKALNSLFDRRKDLRDRLVIELVGLVPEDMVRTPAALSLPPSCVRVIPSVNYIKSLELMYDADILLLIEADVRQNLFLASKVSDYFGANTPMVGLVPPGASHDVFESLGCWWARPGDIPAIAEALEQAVDHVQTAKGIPWCSAEYRDSFDGCTVAARYSQIVESIS